MRKSFIFSVVLHTLAGLATLLWLLWSFIPAGNVMKGLGTLLLAGLACWAVLKSCRRGEQESEHSAATVDLPLLDNQGPVVLVCGDRLDALFQGSPLRKTAQGWWLRAGDIAHLTDVVHSIQVQFPRQIGELSVMYVCQPDLHQDEAVLRSTLKTLRQQSKQIHSLTGFTLPVVVSAEFSGPETPWVLVRGDKPVVYPDNASPQALIDWQQEGENVEALPVLGQAFLFIRNTLLDELEKSDRLTPPVHAFAVAMRLGSVNPEAQSVWSGWLCSRTCLQFSRKASLPAPASQFPDAVLPLLAPFASLVQGGQRTRRLVLLMWLCALAALGISVLNNRDLIRQVGTDLQRWNAIPMNRYGPKAESLAVLKQDALLLERWQRQGEPIRYGLGYYPGQRLWLALQQAIDTWVPPPEPKPDPIPKIVRLDSMSLFDTGKWALKPGSTKLLVNSLVGIKAKPGWLIVVAGHTDSTGDDKSNQVLSLKRAESVRDWMRDTGDVPESCFAVQGYGKNRQVWQRQTGAFHQLARPVGLIESFFYPLCHERGAQQEPYPPEVEKLNKLKIAAKIHGDYIMYPPHDNVCNFFDAAYLLELDNYEYNFNELAYPTFPEYLSIVPERSDIIIKTDDSVPCDGIWEPVKIHYNHKLLIFKGGISGFKNLGAYNYFIRGMNAPRQVYYDVLIESDTEMVIPDDPIHYRDVHWRLVWEDTRYYDGIIPDESEYFLDDASGKRITCPSGEPCPHSGHWATIAGGHQQFIDIQAGQLMPEAIQYQIDIYAPEVKLPATWSLLRRDDGGNVFIKIEKE